MTQSKTEPLPISRLRIVAMLVATFLVFATIFFWPAGTFRWPAAWFYMAVYFANATPVVFWLRSHDPDLLRKRFAMGKSAMKPWDKAIVTTMTFPFLGAFIVPGLDFRFHWSTLPLAVQALSFAGLALSFGFFFRVMVENSYASRIVEIQQGQKVISTGSYGIVRHPMYAAGIAFALFTPLTLGSLWGLIPAALVIPLLALRSVLEEKTLLKELPGYKEYTQKVRHRLVPGLW